jgi:hypothetical protein
MSVFHIVQFIPQHCGMHPICTQNYWCHFARTAYSLPGVMPLLLPWPQNLVWTDGPQDVFSMVQTGGSHLGPNRGSTVHDAEPVNQTFVGSSMFLKLVSPWALVEYTFTMKTAAACSSETSVNIYCLTTHNTVFFGQILGWEFIEQDL